MPLCQKCNVNTSTEDALELCWMPSCPFRLAQARQEFFDAMEGETDELG